MLMVLVPADGRNTGLDRGSANMDGGGDYMVGPAHTGRLNTHVGNACTWCVRKMH